MGSEGLQIAAGVISSLLFASSNFPMLMKAYKTKDLKSYSLAYLVIGNIGNLFHWVYVSSLPFGPIWFLHSFFTVVCAVMLVWYLRYEEGGVFAALGRRLSRLWDRIDEQKRQFPGLDQIRLRRTCACPVPCLCR